MQSGADRLLESLNDQENGYDAEESISDGHFMDNERQEAGFKNSNPKSSEEDTTIRQRSQQQQQNRHKLTIDITSAPSPARPSGASATRDRNEYQAQKSPSGHSSIATSSPRLLYPDNPLRSPGVATPISPRHANRAPS